MSLKQSNTLEFGFDAPRIIYQVNLKKDCNIDYDRVSGCADTLYYLGYITKNQLSSIRKKITKDVSKNVI